MYFIFIKAKEQQNLTGKQKKALAALTYESSTMDLLKRIELRMEMLTQELERLPEEKVKIAQRVSCLCPSYEIFLMIIRENKVFKYIKFKCFT